MKKKKIKNACACPRIAKGHTNQSGAGPHGGTKKARNRRYRRDARGDIKRNDKEIC